jgi:hypothetical protein
MHSDWFNGIEILQGRWQHGGKLGYCYPSGLEKTLCKWDTYILIQKSQQDAHVTEFILSDYYSTFFGYHCRPSSGAQTTVTTASGNRYTLIDRVKFLLLKSTDRLD